MSSKCQDCKKYFKPTNLRISEGQTHRCFTCEMVAKSAYMALQAMPSEVSAQLNENQVEEIIRQIQLERRKENQELWKSRKEDSNG